jgi:hypothetical protein
MAKCNGIKNTAPDFCISTTEEKFVTAHFPSQREGLNDYKSFWLLSEMYLNVWPIDVK